MTDTDCVRGSSGCARQHEPRRTCLACRRSAPQYRLLRFVRTSGGLVQPDPGRAQGGRGAYLCREAACFAEAVRRNRWGQAFRAPSVLQPATIEEVGRLLAGPAGDGAAPRGAETVAGRRSEGTVRESAEGGV